MQLISCVEQESLSVPQPQALCSQRHPHTVLEASEPSLDAEGSPGSGVTQPWFMCLKTTLTSWEQSLFLAPLLSRQPSLKTFFPFCFKQDYGNRREQRNEGCVDAVGGVQDSPC